MNSITIDHAEIKRAIELYVKDRGISCVGNIRLVSTCFFGSNVVEAVINIPNDPELFLPPPPSYRLPGK